MSTIGNLVESLVNKHANNTKVLNELSFNQSKSNKNFEKQILRLTAKKAQLKRSKSNRSKEIDILEYKIITLIHDLKSTATPSPQLYLYQATPLYQKILTLREKKSFSNTVFRLAKLYLLAMVTTTIEDTKQPELYIDNQEMKITPIDESAEIEMVKILESNNNIFAEMVFDPFYNLHLLEQNNWTKSKPKKHQISHSLPSKIIKRGIQSGISLKVNQKALDRTLMN
jgi:hypothetical protein